MNHLGEHERGEHSRCLSEGTSGPRRDAKRRTRNQPPSGLLKREELGRGGKSRSLVMRDQARKG